MTEEQLKQGNELDHKLRFLKGSKKEVKSVLKELELSDDPFKQDDSIIKVDRTECRVNKKRLIDFMWKELETLEMEILSTESELENL